MTPVTPSQVYLQVSIVYTSIHILQTSLVISTTLLVIRVLHLMTQVCSTAHTFLSRWFVPSVRTPSSLRLASRLVMVLLLTHLQKVLHLLLILVLSRLTQTVTTEESRFKTSCDISLRAFTSQRVLRNPLFLSK